MSENRIKDAVELLALTEPGSLEFSDEISRISETYRNLVKYTVLGVKDPQRKKIYQGIQLSLFEISDRIKHKLFESSRMHLPYQQLELEHPTLQVQEYVRELFENLGFHSELKGILQDSDVEDETSTQDFDYKTRKIVSLVFAWLWFGGKLTESDKDLVRMIIRSDRFQWNDKCLMISATTMGLLSVFDLYRFEILFDFYEAGEIQVSQRAFTGLLLGLYFYDNRLFLYPQLVNRLRAYQGEDTLELDAKTLIFQLFRAKDTEKVTKKFRDEIMPDIVKHAPRLEDKLGLNQILKEESEDDKNPKWQKFFEDSPDLISKLEEVTRMQLEGMDVFMGTFANLKHFPFFSELSNWFVPFHTNHQAVEQTLASEDPHFRDVFIDGLNRSYYMCNSDKFSFCLSLASMPQQQKELMIQMFAAEVEGIKEMEKEENLMDSRRQINSIYTQYVQDLYRFFKLFPLRQDLEDIFRSRFDFQNKSFMQHILVSEKAWRSFADFCFEKEFYTEALETYLKINQDGDNSQEVFEKIGYCHEKNNNLEKALEFYKKAELFDENRVWNLRKVARIQWMLKQYEEAIATYKEAELLEPENLHLQITIGNCYLGLKDYKQALNYYYKVELASPGNNKVMRPIAWCLFVTGKLSEARHYYEILMESEPNKYDFMNLGHVFICMNEHQKAIDCYLQSIRHKDNSMQQFMAGFNEDIQYLVKNGVESEDLTIFADYLKYVYEQQRK